MATDCHKLHHKFVFLFSPFVCCVVAFFRLLLLFFLLAYISTIFQGLPGVRNVSFTSVALPKIHKNIYIMCISKKYKIQNTEQNTFGHRRNSETNEHIFFVVWYVDTEKKAYTPPVPLIKFIFTFFVSFLSCFLFRPCFIHFYIAVVSVCHSCAWNNFFPHINEPRYCNTVHCCFYFVFFFFGSLVVLLDKKYSF